MSRDPARPDAGRLAALAARRGLALSAGEADEHATLGEELLRPVRELPADGEPAPTRGPGGRPDRAADPCNAILRRCAIAPTGDGPLAGRRVTVKDSIAVAGLPMTGGSALLRGHVPRRDATVVRRLLAAGGELVAMTNMDDLAFCADGSSSVYGPVLNPFDRKRLAGGSSGGAAASLWYDGIDLAIGGDQGGSARVPASWCGLVGLKPTHGLVPVAGTLGFDRTLDHVGPLAHTVADVALLLDAIAGADEDDPAPPPPAPAAAAAVAAAREDLRGVSIGLLDEGLSPALGVEPATADALRALADELRAGGADVRLVSVPEHLHTAAIELPISCEGLAAVLAGGLNGYGWQGRYAPELAAAVREGLAQRGGELSRQVRAGLLFGAWLAEAGGGAWYARAQNAVAPLRRAYERALAGLDALLLPATPYPARTAAAAAAARLDEGWAPLANTAQFNLTGHPAVSLPLCEAGGLPLGAMLVGRRHEDAALLATARTLEACLPRRPEGGPALG